MPAEPPTARTRTTFATLAYPCVERGGLIFAYFGAGEPPQLPDYEFFDYPPEHRVLARTFLHCNWLQSMEGEIDPSHLSYLHVPIGKVDTRPVPGGTQPADQLYKVDIAPKLEVERTRVRHAQLFGAPRRTRRTLSAHHQLRAARHGDDHRQRRAHRRRLRRALARAGRRHAPPAHRLLLQPRAPADKEFSESHDGRASSGPTATSCATPPTAICKTADAMQTETFSGMGQYFPAHDAFATEIARADPRSHARASRRRATSASRPRGAS